MGAGDKEGVRERMNAKKGQMVFVCLGRLRERERERECLSFSVKHLSLSFSFSERKKYGWIR